MTEDMTVCIGELMGPSKKIAMEQKMEYIVLHARVYNICHRNAGWAFQFYEPPDGVDVDEHPYPHPSDREFLHVYEYHQTFRRAVNAEYARLGGV